MPASWVGRFLAGFLHSQLVPATFEHRSSFFIQVPAQAPGSCVLGLGTGACAGMDTRPSAAGTSRAVSGQTHGLVQPEPEVPEHL